MNRHLLRRPLACAVLFAVIFSLVGEARSSSIVARSITRSVFATREPVRGRHAMVASQHELASKIGIDILKKGGNAVDAAIAVGLALAVVYPEAGNIGGGGFMLIHLNNGINTSIDYREKAPLN